MSITIPPGRTLRQSVLAAIAAAPAATVPEFVLADGDFILDARLVVTRQIVLRAANAGNATVTHAGPADSRYGPDSESGIEIAAGAGGTVIQGLNFKVSGARMIHVDHAANVALRQLTFAGAAIDALWTDARGRAQVTRCGGYWGIDAEGADGLTIVGLVMPEVMSSYGVYIRKGRFDTAKAIAISGYSHRGSLFQHGLRVSDVDGMTLGSCDLGGPIKATDGPGIKGVGGITLRGGCRNVTFTSCTIVRPSVGKQTNGETPTLDNIVFDACTILPAGHGIDLHPTSSELATIRRTNQVEAAPLPTGVKLNGVWVTPPAGPVASPPPPVPATKTQLLAMCDQLHDAIETLAA